MDIKLVYVLESNELILKDLKSTIFVGIYVSPGDETWLLPGEAPLGKYKTLWHKKEPMYLPNNKTK